MSVTVQINGTKREYSLIKTTAPASYDGFGTFTLHEHPGDNPMRHVLVDVEYLDWQQQRYGSGNHFHEGDEDVPTEWVAGQLWQRIQGTTEL